MKKTASFSTSYLCRHPVEWMQLLRKRPESYWVRRGELMVAKLFRDMQQDVPAYKTFLSTHAPTLKAIQSISDIPIINKDSYLRSHALKDLCWNGDLSHGQRIISSTSGSTGEPFYFPRTIEQDEQYAAVAEMYLRNNFKIHERTTLYIVAWGLGVWIGGIFSYAAVRMVAERGKYPLSVITTGISEEEILKAVRRLGPMYDQVIIGGYPPMVKDVIDHGKQQGIDWSAYNVKCIFSAEGFSEQFRDHISHLAGFTNLYTDALNHYGTVDLGTMAHETPLTILIRRLAKSNPSLNTELFGHPHRQPTLAQYIPELFFFESYEGNLICSARSGLPLVRYDLIDSGGIKSLSEISNILSRHGVSLEVEAAAAGISELIWNLPCVYVFERSDFTVKLNGANIYPQEIRGALEYDEISSFVTGRFTMSVDYDEAMDQQLTVTVEMQEGKQADPSLSEQICELVIRELLSKNSEYANNVRGMGREKNTPIMRLATYGEAPLFTRSGKHRWVRKSGH